MITITSDIYLLIFSKSDFSNMFTINGHYDYIKQLCTVQAALVICGLFTCDFAYMRLKNGLFPGTYPPIYGIPRSFCVQIHYMRAYFWSPYLSHITRSACTVNYIKFNTRRTITECVRKAGQFKDFLREILCFFSKYMRRFLDNKKILLLIMIFPFSEMSNISVLLSTLNPQFEQEHFKQQFFKVQKFQLFLRKDMIFVKKELQLHVHLADY